MYNKDVRKEVSDQCRLLLIMAQNGNRWAKDDIIELIRTHVMYKRIGRYLNRNRQVENDDIRQEFLIGVAKGIDNADLTIGDPMEYIVFRGLCNVKSYMRKRIRQGTYQICGDCGSKSRLNRTKTGYQCLGCGSTNIETFEVEDHNDILLENITEAGFEEDVVSQLLMDEFKNTLTPGTNVYNLYTLLEEGIDKDNPAVKNYIKEIARIWGGCSDENVVQCLRKLRSRLSKWMSESEVFNMSI